MEPHEINYIKMRDQPSLETMVELVKYVDTARKYYEDNEEYELCADMRDFNVVFSDYCLGYKKYSEIEGSLYDYIAGCGTIRDIDSRTGSIWIEHPMGNIFVFHDLSFQEVCAWQNILTELNERKRRKKE